MLAVMPAFVFSVIVVALEVDVFVITTLLLCTTGKNNSSLSLVISNRSVFSMSTYDNLLAVVQLTIKKPERQRSMVEQLLTEFNLQHLRNINANLLSGGEVRRLQIARTLINNPKVILLDEPMAALDPIVVQDIQKYILKLQAYGCGIIITEHSIQNLFQICDRATVIGEHTIIAEGKPKDILQSTKARELYFGSFDS